jgi:hypothetical protein
MPIIWINSTRQAVGMSDVTIVMVRVPGGISRRAIALELARVWPSHAWPSAEVKRAGTHLNFCQLFTAKAIQVKRIMERHQVAA